jgi:predicted GIY-YIG superfamily endonuclease
MAASDDFAPLPHQEPDAPIGETGASWITYLLHFDRPYKHTRHYTGTAADLQARLADHQAGRGARLLQVAKDAGISWVLARTWPGGRQRERQLKIQGGASRRCPLCGVEPRTTPAQQEEKTTMTKPPDKSASAAADAGRRRPDYVIETWVSEQLRDRIQRSGPSLDEALRTTNRPERESEPDLEPEP